MGGGSSCWLSRGVTGQVAQKGTERRESHQHPPKKVIRFLPHDSTAAEYTRSAFAAEGPSFHKGQLQNHQKGICLW